MTENDITIATHRLSGTMPNSLPALQNTPDSSHKRNRLIEHNVVMRLRNLDNRYTVIGQGAHEFKLIICEALAQHAANDPDRAGNCRIDRCIVAHAIKFAEQKRVEFPTPTTIRLRQGMPGDMIEQKLIRARLWRFQPEPGQRGFAVGIDFGRMRPGARIDPGSEAAIFT